MHPHPIVFLRFTAHHRCTNAGVPATVSGVRLRLEAATSVHAGDGDSCIALKNALSCPPAYQGIGGDAAYVCDNVSA
jgi:hypothetical protein